MSDEETRYEFDQAFQHKIVSMFLRDTTFALRVKDLVKPEYFTEAAAKTLVRITQEHIKVYRSVPDMKILPTILKDEINAKRIRQDELGDLRDLIGEVLKADLSNPGFVSKKISDFARHQAMEQAILASVGYLEKGDFSKIERDMKNALSVGEQADGDEYEYFAEIDARTKKRDDILNGRIVRTGITTGYPAIDAYLYHYGWGRKELSCLMGAAKAGKSLGLGDFTKNAAIAGYNALYVSAEVSRDIIADRLDAANADTLIRELHKDPQKVKAAIQALQAKAAPLYIREVPSGAMKPSQLHRMIEKYRADGVVLDLVTVDYADIMAAEYRSDSLIENLRSIYIDLRAIAYEFNVALLTATQTNRDGAKSMTAKATDVGDDWNKARTVDILIGINATEAEKQAGEARLYWALSRNTKDGFQIRIQQDREKMKFLTKVLGQV